MTFNMEKELRYGQMDQNMTGIIKTGRSTALGNTTGMMGPVMKGNGKTIQYVGK